VIEIDHSEDLMIMAWSRELFIERSSCVFAMQILFVIEVMDSSVDET